MLASTAGTVAASPDSRRLWSLWDMLEFQAIAFYDTVTLLREIRAYIDFPKHIKDSTVSVDLPMSKDVCKHGAGRLRDLVDSLKVLGTRLTMIAAARLAKRLDEDITYQDFGVALAEIDARLRDELSSVILFVMDSDRAKYHRASPPFGTDVPNRFPAVIDDVEGAAKCLALGQGTASVLHLMRVLEVGLKALGQALGIPYAPSWESYLTQISTRIGAKHKTKGIQWKRDEKFYRDVSGDLLTIKQAWRNPTMHVGRKYSVDEAEEIFRATRSFMQALAKGLPKTVVKKKRSGGASLEGQPS